ncbi:6-phosphogluconolactonase [Pseudohalioglobus sediminis]|uniref:6-phosphogluconolactonase n=2 Tax=Pseudohalioglobus sediminis TaxID=2606449 RepID=A0A5B0WRE9_9GAMM|nr:6-phosphogluconolactonase [Pseudohalioglobus sediminis]
MGAAGMSEHLFDHADTRDEALAKHIADALQRDISARGAASIAVSGGRSPRGLFLKLAARPLDWSRVHITLVDERWVDTASADSNERLVRETLLQGPAADANFIGLKTAHADPREAIPALVAALATMPLPLTCVVLGMGDDGHTASWFPQASNLGALLDPDNPAPVAVCDPVTAPHLRMTLTLPVVLAASEIMLYITGDAKREVLARAAAADYPVAAITAQQHNPASIWWAP